ncbi:MAG: ATP-binding protein [Spirochaetota bacterium]
MSLGELDRLMSLPEGEHLEFKEAKTSFEFELLVKYCVALANEGGGAMVLGVTDKLPRRVVGTQAFLDLEKTKAGIASRLHIRVDAEELSHPAGRVLLFTVPSRPIGMPIHYEGRYFMRSGEDLVPMLPDVLRRIFEESGPDYSAEPVEAATIDDLDPASIEAFRQRWMRKAGDERIAGRGAEQLLADAELLVGGKLTIAALVLFGTREALGRLLAQSELIFEYRSSDASGPAQARKEFRQGFFSWYDELWSTINLRNDLQHFQSGLFVLDVPTFNERAVREAVLNAVSHRDYRMAGSVFVRQYQRRIEIVSPGGLPPGIQLETILWEQSPRNRRIAESLARAGLVERAGQGMNLIYESCIRESKAEPDFSHSDAQHFWVTLHGELRNPEFLRVLESIGKDRVDAFSTAELIVIDRVFSGVSIPARLETARDRLLEEGLVEKIGKGKRGYMLARRLYAAVSKSGIYTRKKGLDRETNKELLFKHIKESSGARMEEFRQVLPFLERSQIQVLLRELSEEGRIHHHGATRAARWYPGADSGDCNHGSRSQAKLQSKLQFLLSIHSPRNT